MNHGGSRSRTGTVRRSSLFAPFQVRSFRFQYPADLLTSWGPRWRTCPRLVHPGRNRIGAAAHTVRFVAVFRHAGRTGVRHGGRPAGPPQRAVCHADRLRDVGQRADGLCVHRDAATGPRLRHRGRRWTGAAIGPCDAQCADRRDHAGPALRKRHGRLRAQRPIPREPSAHSPERGCSPRWAWDRPMWRSPASMWRGFC